MRSNITGNPVVSNPGKGEIRRWYFNMKKDSAERETEQDDPVNEVTNLCGARVITTTPSEVKAICQFSELHFDIDWENNLECVLAHDPDNAGLAVRIGQLTISVDNWKKAIHVLSPFAAQEHQEVLKLLGFAMTKKYRKTSKGKNFRQGQNYLEMSLSRDLTKPFMESPLTIRPYVLPIRDGIFRRNVGLN
jgi:hypothetical protein